MNELPSWFLPLVGVVIAVLMALFGYVIKLAQDVAEIRGDRRVTCEQHGKALECIPPLKVKIERLDQRIEDYMRELDRALNQSLRDWPTHVERDLLMDKLEHGHLSLEEVQRLDRLLVEDMLESTDANRKFRMGMTRARLTWLKSKLEDCHAK